MAMEETWTRRWVALVGERQSELLKRFWKMFRMVVRRPMGAGGLAIVIFFTILAVFAPWIVGGFPSLSPPVNLGPPDMPPSPGFPMGTDAFGQSNWALLVYGARVSLIVGIASSLVAMVLGTLFGVTSGYYGGSIDRALSMITDFFLVIPWLPFVLVLVLVLGRGFGTTITAIAIVSWPTTARILRAETLSLRTRGYVLRARAIGAGDRHIIVHHMLPVLGPLMFANLILTVSSSIFTESFLAFFGLEDPTVASWGTMIQLSYLNVDFAAGRWWAILPPGISITTLVLAFAMLSFVLEEILNPRLRVR